mgnify:CR=1 FL=1
MAMKNLSKAEVLTLKDQVNYQEGQVVSKTLAQNPFISVTLFAFDKGEEISTHESDSDAFVRALTAWESSRLTGNRISCTKANPS